MPRQPSPKSPRRINAISHAKLLRALVDGPATAHELAAESGLSEWTVASHLRSFEEELLVHVCGWEQDSLGRDQTAIYKWGKGKNAPKRAASNSEHCKAYRERKKQRELLHAMAGRIGQPRSEA